MKSEPRTKHTEHWTAHWTLDLSKTVAGEKATAKKATEKKATFLLGKKATEQKATN